MCNPVHRRRPLPGRAWHHIHREQRTAIHFTPRSALGSLKTGTFMAAHGEFVSVLVVDEDPAILALIAAILDRNGLRALLARDAEEAMAIARRGYVPIDLILCDIEISGMSGADLTRRLLEIRPDTRVLYMSAFV